MKDTLNQDELAIIVRGKITVKMLSWPRRCLSVSQFTARPVRTWRPQGRLLLEQLEDRVVPSTVQFSVASETVSQSAGTFTIPVNLAGNVSSTTSSITYGLALGGTSYPAGLALDASGNLYFTDGASGVDKVTPAGVVSTFLSGNSTPNNPIDSSGLAFDTAGNLYIANWRIGTVSEVTPAGIVSTFSSAFNSPTALAFDAAGNLYVADSSGAVSKVTPAGVVSTFASAGLSKPDGLAFDAAGNLFVANAGNGTLSEVTPAGAVSTFAFEFDDPAGLAFDAAGDLFVANAGNGTVSEVTPAGVVSTFASGFASPTALAFDSTGRLYVLQNSAIDKVTPDGVVSAFLVGLSEPQGLAADAAGNLFVANNGNGTVSEVTPAGVVSTFASGFDKPSGLTFDSAGNLFVANNGNGTVSEVTPAGAVSTFASGFDDPTGLAFDAAGNLFVANLGNGTVSEVTPEGVVSTFASGFGGPTALAIDGEGNLYVANVVADSLSAESVVDKVTPAGVISTFVSESGEAQGLAFDAAGTLYISAFYYYDSGFSPNPVDTYYGILYEVTPAGGTANAIANVFADPTGLAFDSLGNLYLADVGYSSGPILYKVPAYGSVTFTLGGSAVAGANYSGVTASPLVFPAGVTTAFITGTLLPNPSASSETLTFTLGTPTGTSLGSPSVNTLTIPAFGDIAGVVFHDDNANGVLDAGEQGLPNQTVQCLSDGQVVETTTTDANGDYSLTGLAPGAYTVSQVLFGGELQSTPSTGSLQVTVTAGATTSNQDFGDVLTSSVVPLVLPSSSSFPAQGNANADYVEALYRAILNRNADPGGLIGWVGELNNGVPRLQVVQAIWDSPEHFTQEVTNFYLTILGRQPDSAGLSAWVQQMEMGAPEQAVAAAFLLSPEYLGQGDLNFVDHLYSSILGRSADAAGAASWLALLGDDSAGNPTQTPTLTPAQVVDSFITSTESLERLVEGDYEVMLQRQADAAGLNAWVQELQQGLPFASIGQQFLATDEFFNNAAANG